MSDNFKILEIDPYLEPFKGDISHRYKIFKDTLNDITVNYGNVDEFTRSYECYGLILHKNKEITCKEWIPGVKKVFLVGDFNDWSCTKHPLSVDNFGVWTCKIPPIRMNKNLIPAIPDHSKYKLLIITESNEEIYRISPWARYVIPDPKTKVYDSIFMHSFFDESRYVFKYDWPLKDRKQILNNKSLRIYEAHVGIASKDGKVASYNDFKQNVVPRIKNLGYNAVQLMAIMEHAYYASFGYQITSFYAVSSRYGLPDELKGLIDELHKNGIVVLLDVVHSHASSNIDDGLNNFNGTNACFFHGNERGNHELWDSRLFNYKEPEVQRFLLSNLRWFIEEYHFDGFRFDGVTSMLYHSHGIAHSFSGDYHEYFGTFVDVESVTYLQLANHFLHKIYPNVITIAEEVSGIPGLCLTVEDGGFGFDYRLAMALPDMWIKILKEIPDENWDMAYIAFTLTNRRWMEKHVAYAESHDQALVGDKTLAFWLMDKEMYFNMSCLQEKNMVVHRGLALHKMIRLLTCALGGEAYLNFIGNEFGHPEWLDFPRIGNNDSYHYARRQWDLVDSNHLRYQFLNLFDKCMNELEDEFGWLSSPQAWISTKNEADKVLVFERGNLLWIFNYHPTQSFSDYRIGTSMEGIYKVALTTDDKKFDGDGHIDQNVSYHTQDYAFNGRDYSLMVYIPCRVALVLRLDKDSTK